VKDRFLRRHHHTCQWSSQSSIIITYLMAVIPNSSYRHWSMAVQILHIAWQMAARPFWLKHATNGETQVPVRPPSLKLKCNEWLNWRNYERSWWTNSIHVLACDQQILARTFSLTLQSEIICSSSYV
jgi:hypothetical protein